MLASTASESPGKTRHESQFHLSSRTEQHQRTGRPVEDACSSSYSEWNVDKTWSSQEWKSDELMEVRTGRPVLFAQHTDRFMETPVAPAMPCKISKNNQNLVTRGKSNEIKSKLACFLEALESTRLRMGNLIPHHHEDHIAGKGDNSLQHYNLVHKFILMPQAMKIPAAKAAVDKKWEKLEKISAWDINKSQK